MKKIISVIICGVLLGSLCACEGGKGSSSSSVGAISTKPSSSDASEEQSKASESEESSTVESKYNFTKAIPLSDKADESYFDNVVMVGDSVTLGTTIYKYFGNAQVIAHEGVNPSRAGEKVYENETGSKVTFADAVGTLENIDKVYIMLGTNGLAWLSVSGMTEDVMNLAKLIQEKRSDVKIIIEAIAPFTATKHSKDSRYDNDKVREYNDSLLKMCGENGFYFLNTYEAFATSGGNMDDDLSTDGVHFGRTLYEAWGNYILTHTV